MQDASAAIELDPEYGNAYCNRAWACLFLERVPEAMKWFAKAIECLSTAEHKPVNLIFNRVRAKRGMGLLTSAIEDATLALSMNRMHVLTCCERGLAYYELGQMAQAEADFTRARTYNPASTCSRSAAGTRVRKLTNESVGQFRIVSTSSSRCCPMSSGSDRYYLLHNRHCKK